MLLMLSLLDMRMIGIIGGYAQRMLVQLTALHSYLDLKLAFLYDASEEKKWEFVRWFPHSWDDNGNFRAIASGKQEISAIESYLERFLVSN